jgi:hypothetical protein
LTVNDIHYQPPRKVGQAIPTSRLTMHHFVNLPKLGLLIPIVAPQNSDARQPQDTSKWPPAIILDFFYAVAAMKAWSSECFLKYVQEQSRNAYHNNNALDSGGPSHVDAQMALKQKARH